MSYLWVLLILAAVVLIATLWIIERRNSNKKESQINDLFHSINNYRRELKSLKVNKTVNKRSAHRIMIPETDMEFEIIGSGDPKYAGLIGKKGKGKIEDLSSTGMRFACEYDLPIRVQLKVKLDFDFGGETFSIEAELVRKDSHFERDFILYGAHFENVSYQTEEKLASEINKEKIKKNKNLTHL